MFLVQAEISYRLGGGQLGDGRLHGKYEKAFQPD
jgi:hypothetical protein